MVKKYTKIVFFNEHLSEGQFVLLCLGGMSFGSPTLKIQRNDSVSSVNLDEVDRW